MNTAEPKNQDQIEAKRDPKLLETESVQNIISDINNIGKRLESDPLNTKELLEPLKTTLSSLEEPLFSAEISNKLVLIPDLDLIQFKSQIVPLLSEDIIKRLIRCLYDLTSDQKNQINSTSLATIFTPILINTSGQDYIQAINNTVQSSKSIARIIEHYPCLFENQELKSTSSTQTEIEAEERSNEDYKAKYIKLLDKLNRLGYEGDIKSSIIGALRSKVDVLEKQIKVTSSLSEATRSDDKYNAISVSSTYSNEGLSDDESQKSDEMPQIRVHEQYLSTHHSTGHLSLPVSPMKIDASQEWSVKEKKYLEYIHKLEFKVNSASSKKRKEEMERLRKKLVESEQQRRTLSNELKNLQKQVALGQRKSSLTSPNKADSQSSSLSHSNDSVSKNDTLHGDTGFNLEKAKDHIEVRMLTIDEEEYTNLQYLLFTWMVVALKLTAMAEGKVPQNIDKQLLFQRAMETRLDYASWPALIMDSLK